MPDYLYLLENRLSSEQQKALKEVIAAARLAGMPMFLAGGAVRDLTSGFPARDLDVSVQGNALKLLKPLEKAGATLHGEHEPSQTIYLKFPGGVRIEVASTRTETFPKPGRPEYHLGASIQDDLRRRDFTVDAMALSLNEGSYGLLMDPLNGSADIESRQLKLVSNYGFIEDPARLVRAARFVARYGWTMEEKTAARYEAAKTENYIENLSAFARGYELEEIAHEEDALRVLTHLETEGWMKALLPAWTHGKADAAKLEELRETVAALQAQGINPDASGAQMELLTAKLSADDTKTLKRLIPRKGFVAEWESLDKIAKEFAKKLLGKEYTTPSAAWKLITTYQPEAVLWLAMTGKGAAIQTKFRNFFTVWPQARQKIPYMIMQEMRITPSLPGYQDLQHKLFFEFMDSKLTTEEQIRKYLEPHSPPAPPPPMTMRRARAAKKAESKKSAKKAAALAAPAVAGDAAAGKGAKGAAGAGLKHGAAVKAIAAQAAENAKTAKAGAKQDKAAVKQDKTAAKQDKKAAKAEVKHAAKAAAKPEKKTAKAVPHKAAKKAAPVKKAVKKAAKKAVKPSKPAKKAAGKKKAVPKKAAPKKAAAGKKKSAPKKKR